MRIAIIVPVFGAIFLFHEMPTAAQWVGIILTIVSLVLLRPAQDGHPHGAIGWGTVANMLLLVLSNGAGFLAWKMVHFYGCGTQTQEFLCLLFGIPMMTCAAESGIRGGGVTRAAILIGIILGLCNVCSVRTSLEGLRTIPTVIFFPIYSCGGVILNAAVAWIFWRERLTRQNVMGIATGCLALLCMNPE
jgi:multidrug transporter EmrE-like cation transporter